MCEVDPESGKVAATAAATAAAAVAVSAVLSNKSGCSSSNNNSSNGNNSDEPDPGESCAVQDRIQGRIQGLRDPLGLLIARVFASKRDNVAHGFSLFRWQWQLVKYSADIITQWVGDRDLHLAPAGGADVGGVRPPGGRGGSSMSSGGNALRAGFNSGRVPLTCMTRRWCVRLAGSEVASHNAFTNGP